MTYFQNPAQWTDDTEIEDTELYHLITKHTKLSLREAWELADNLSDHEFLRRSTRDRSTYLHHIVNQATEVHKKYGSTNALVPLIYRLAINGVRVNAQNEHGNTALHLACIRPNADTLCPHLLRIGVDPCIRNKKDCRIIHTYHKHRFALVKGQQIARSGLWNAVEKEDVPLVEQLLKTWCRVNVRKNKSIRDVAEETANQKISKLLSKFELTNEVACAAFACDVSKVKELMLRGEVDINQKDESCEVPKPLVVAVQELGDIAKHMVKLLVSYGCTFEGYENELDQHKQKFENTDFYLLCESGTIDNLTKAIQLIADGKVDIKLRSYQEETNGWTYLHYVVDRYIRLSKENEEAARILIRALYRLGMAGIDVNTRDALGETALVKAGCSNDGILMAHVIRIGGDPSVMDKSGRAVNEEVYEDKGKLVFDKKYRQADLPGIWVAVETNDIPKAERWLKSWCRVKVKRGDRKLIDVARAKKRKEIVQLLEEFEHINEFVCATFACDINAMMNIIALGKGGHKVNTIDEFFHVGFTWDRHAEFMPRPIIITAMEICTPDVVDFLLNFGADLSKEHEETAPCGPAAFWAFQDHVSNENALVVAKHADVELRDELGCTMLHKLMQKNRSEGKVQILEELLDRDINVAARDWEGSTARDYITIYNIDDGDVLRQTIDDYVLELVNNDQHVRLEDLLLEGYDHVLDITGMKRHKIVTAQDIAELKEYKEIIELLDDWDTYRGEIDLLHRCAQSGDLTTISKLSDEKRCAWSKDKAGRTLLHNAVLYQHPEIVNFITEQYPHLINTLDNLKRTPLHFCVCLKDRHLIWPTLQDGGSDPNLIDANNMSVYDYVRELETPTPKNGKPRGRRWRDYRPQTLIEWERAIDYGAKAERHELARLLRENVKKESLSDIKQITKDFSGDLSKDDLDIPILKICVENKRERVAKHIISECKARAHCSFEVKDKNGGTQEYTLKEYCKKHDLKDLVAFIKTCPEPVTEEAQEGEQLTNGNGEENNVTNGVEEGDKVTNGDAEGEQLTNGNSEE